MNEIGIIWFCVREAYEYLIDNDEVYTLRPNNPKENGKHQLKSTLYRYDRVLKREHHESYVGVVNVEFVNVFTFNAKYREYISQELEDYVAKSGFKTLSEWLAHVKGLKRNDELYLYHVTTIRIDFD